MIQFDPAYLEVIKYLKSELCKLGLSEDLVQSLVEVNQVAGKSEAVKPLVVQFPDKDSANKFFDMEKLTKSLHEALNQIDVNKVVTNPDLGLFSQQVSLFHEFLRLVSRKKQRRIDRVLAAGHRRLNNGSPDGKVERALVKALQIRQEK